MVSFGMMKVSGIKKVMMDMQYSECVSHILHTLQGSR